MILKKKFLFALLLTSVIALSACTPTAERINPIIISPTPSASTQVATDSGKQKAIYELTATRSGEVALDLLQSQAEVATKDYGAAGKFITSVNNLEGNNEYYWAFYLNGKYAEKGAGQTTLNKGDIIKFVYEAVQLTQ